MIGGYSLDWRIKFPDAVSASGNLRRGISVDRKTEVFIYRARQLYGDFYNYDNLTYVSAKTKVTIVCPVHGKFEQTPDNHLHGFGCISCGRVITAASRRLDTSSFIKKAAEVHGSVYDYSQVDYFHSTEKVDIICKLHGVFKQVPAEHLQGKGCFRCSNNPDRVYIMTDGLYYKVGISSLPKRRAVTLSKDMNVNLKLVAVSDPTPNARCIEAEIHKMVSDNPYKNESFSGYTEWRKLSPEELNFIIDKFNLRREYNDR